MTVALAPLFVFTVIFAFPGFIPLITPDLVTDTIFLFELAKLFILSKSLFRENFVAMVFPVDSWYKDFLNFILFFTGFDCTVTLHSAVAPLFMVTVITAVPFDNLV